MMDGIMNSGEEFLEAWERGPANPGGGETDSYRTA